MSIVLGWLVVTQVMNERDPALGFFVRWVRGFVRLGVAPLHVVCWQADPGLTIPGVVIHVLPRGLWSRVWGLVWLSWRLRKNVGSVFIHMIPPVVVALGWWWKMLGFWQVLWYTHGTVSWSLRIANIFVDRILTASKESCRLQTAKKRVVGHGIDLMTFFPDMRVPRGSVLLTVGRITPRKDLKTFMDICASLRIYMPRLSFHAVIIGEPRTEDDRVYAQELQTYARLQGVEDLLEWTGALFGEALRAQYQRAGVFVTTSQTGSLDKVVLEALACGAPVVAKGQIYAQVEGVFSFQKKEGMLEKIGALLVEKPSFFVGRRWVKAHANLDRLLERIGVYMTYRDT